MANCFNLEIITPLRKFFGGEVESLVVTTVGGQMGVMKGTIPLVTALVSGTLQIKVDGKWHYAANSEGFMEVTPEKTVIFCQTAFWPAELEQEELLEKQRIAQEAMQNAKSKKAFIMARLSLLRAKAQINVKTQHENDALFDK